jgi:hypothetical protein
MENEMKEKGQGLVEFVLILVLVAILVIIVIGTLAPIFCELYGCSDERAFSAWYTYTDLEMDREYRVFVENADLNGADTCLPEIVVNEDVYLLDSDTCRVDYFLTRR